MFKMVDFIKGGFIGIANVIPGLSGGTLAVILGVYDRLIGGLSELLKHPIKVLKDLSFLILGVFAGIVVAIYVIVFFLKNYPIPTTMLFVGFILGGIPKVYSLVKEVKRDLIHIALFIATLIIIVALPLIGGKDILVLNITFGNIIILILVGILAASAMVIPGVSGSMVLIILGYYFFITRELSNFINSLLSIDLSEALTSFVVLFPFGIGVLIGIFGLAKLIKYLLSNHYSYVYYAILGLIVASPIPIILLMEDSIFDVWNILFGILTFAGGMIFSLKMSSLKERLFKIK